MSSHNDLRLRGLVAATFTPFDAGGRLALDRIGPVVEHLLGQGLSGVFLGGTTGEGPSLTVAERMEMAEAYAGHLDGRLKTIVHVGHNSLRDAVALARHARELGVDAIAMTPPSYFPIRAAHQVVDCLAEVAQAVPDVPMYYYHIPRLTAVDIDVLELLQRAAPRVPSLVGIKYSDSSLDRLQMCVSEYGERVNFLFGVDEMLLSGLMAGAHGAVGSTYGFLGPKYVDVIAAFERGDLEDASRLQAHVTRIVHAILRQPMPSALKAAMGLLGADCGPPRAPLSALSETELESLSRELGALGLQVRSSASKDAE